MGASAFSVHVYGIYLAVLGATLLIAPNLLLRLFAVTPTTEPWLRVLGAVVFVLGGYYMACARAEATAFFRATVRGRTLILVLFAALVAIGFAPWQLILFGVIDAVGAAWTARALRSGTAAAPRPAGASR